MKKLNLIAAIALLLSAGASAMSPGDDLPRISKDATTAGRLTGIALICGDHQPARAAEWSARTGEMMIAADALVWPDVGGDLMASRIWSERGTAYASGLFATMGTNEANDMCDGFDAEWDKDVAPLIKKADAARKQAIANKFGPTK